MKIDFCYVSILNTSRMSSLIVKIDFKSIEKYEECITFHYYNIK